MKGRAQVLNQSRSDQRVASAGGGPSSLPPAINPIKGLPATDSLPRLNLTVGQQKILEGLERGRRIAIQKQKLKGAVHASWVRDLAMKDLAAGGPARGRAKRIAIDLDRKLTERSVLRILAKLSVCPIASVKIGQTFTEVAHAK